MLKFSVILFILFMLNFSNVYVAYSIYEIPTKTEDPEQQESILMQINEAIDFFTPQEIVFWYLALKKLINQEISPIDHPANSILLALQKRLLLEGIFHELNVSRFMLLC